MEGPAETLKLPPAPLSSFLCLRHQDVPTEAFCPNPSCHQAGTACIRPDRRTGAWWEGCPEREGWGSMSHAGQSLTGHSEKCGN